MTDGLNEKRGRGRPMQEKLRCQHCKRRKARERFYNNRDSFTGKASVCIECNTEYCLLRSYRRMLKAKGHGAIRDMIRSKLQHVHMMRKVLNEQGLA